MDYDRYKDIKLRSIAILISKNHLLASSHLLLTDDFKWRHNGKEFEKKCTDGSENFVLSDFDSLEVFSPATPKDTSEYPLRLNPTKLIFLKICYKGAGGAFQLIMSPLIIEFKTTLPGSTPCLIDDSKVIESQDPVDFYGLHSGKLLVSPVGSQSFTVSGIPGMRFGQSFLIKDIDGKSTLLSVNTYGENESVFARVPEVSFFYNMNWLRDDICELTGICPKGMYKEITKPSTSIPSTSTPRTSDSLPTTTEIIQKRTSATEQGTDYDYNEYEDEKEENNWEEGDENGFDSDGVINGNRRRSQINKGLTLIVLFCLRF
ncbi:hypothetical protein GCK72_001801 [Caenorhabditis remanei]|uniref:Uncharacterized protein n=1 Tax=Caenorhabditis remanei TaxID=31234 RepID=A0A6A5HTM5_CAERE|nr:hypothetical protein GCK72_001801 [Caenorhabditis remanei]KAF1769984.1 hypothetical protein GCK72_001801 [Caenorhabditis remanei]